MGYNLLFCLDRIYNRANYYPKESALKNLFNVVAFLNKNRISMKLENVNIAVIGLGYVGLPLAVEFGKKRKVIGFDIQQKRVDELASGADHTLEVSPQELKLATHLKFTTDLAELKNSNFFIVTVPTPIDKVNRPDLTPLQKASETIGKVLKRGDIVVFNFPAGDTVALNPQCILAPQKKFVYRF